MKRAIGFILGLTALLSTSGLAQSQSDNWPTRPVTLIVPYAAGGYTDVVARIVANSLEKEIGKPVVVEVRPGGGGMIGTQFVAQSAPDGYTFCVCSVGAISVVPFIQKVNYDPIKDLAPVGLVSTAAQAVMVRKDLPVKNIAELVAYAKERPGKLNYGSSGVAGLTHYAVRLFESRTGMKAQHVPFKGGSQATLALVAGEIDFSFGNMTDALPQIEAGTVRVIAVTSQEPVPFLPNVPTIHQALLPGFLAESWNGIMAPAGTPKPIIQRMADILNKMADDPAVVESLAKAGSAPVKGSPEKYAAQIRAEADQWGPLLKAIVEKK
ncbi:MAG: tripartite tricarboxylate transporter substrate binding protein [Rhizobiales bacterium]|nr:tripartite tricarboxylate transporter substrate binding protein [Hyphomicrobiales bacterium]